MKKTLLLVTAALTLSACSPDKLFSMLARSDVEQAAGEAVKQSEQVTVTKAQEMEDLKPKYDQWTGLKDLTEAGNFGTAYRNQFNEELGFEHHVLAVLPEPQGKTFYEGWLVNPDTKDFISTGAMGITPDHQGFSLTFRSETDYTDYSQVVVTLEATPDDQPETHVLEGEFTLAN